MYINEHNKGLSLRVLFAYGWKMLEEEQEDGTTLTFYQPRRISDEVLESPVVLTKEQIIQWLNAYWTEKFQPLDALTGIIEDTQSLVGFSQEY
jgi:putative SOS response-associated peptidase YedK